MTPEIFAWESDTLGCKTELRRWGWYGRPVLFFPTTGGAADELERFGMVQALKPLIEGGRIKLYGLGSPAAERLTDRDLDGKSKSELCYQLDTFVVNEVVPRIEADCEDTEERFVAAGIATGAHQAVNTVAKHPDRFDVAIGLSGTYDFDRWMEDYFDENYYFNQPIRFVPHLEGEALEEVQSALFVLASGTGRWEDPEQTRRMAGVLQGKHIPVSLELWGEDAEHDWSTWRTMLPLFLDRLL